jgi:hypothetical protein
MRYRAFISSTYRDLKPQRRHVSERLQKANIDVVRMEDFAAGEHPAQLSAKTIAGCHFCIAIIAFQRGTVSTIDKAGRSITQVEIDTAKEMGIGVLPFILKDTDANRSEWPVEFNDLESNAVKDWRRQCETNFTCEFFDAGEMPDVLPAVSRQITKWEHQRTVRLRWALAVIACTLAALFLLLAASVESRKWVLSHFLAYHDPVVFQNSSDGTYKVSRLLEGRAEIEYNEDLKTHLDTAKHSFVMFANTLGVFRKLGPSFEAAAARGVKLRFVMTDFSNANEHNWTAFQAAVEPLAQGTVETLANAANIRQMIESLIQKYPGQVEYRLNQQPLFYTLWVRDPERPDGMAHLCLFFYGNMSQGNWPAIRVSKITGGGELQTLEQQFETIWDRAIKPKP